MLRLFASVRVAAGTGRVEVPGSTVGDVVAALERQYDACERYGSAFAAQVATCHVWLNGDPAGDSDPVVDSDEVAILPPVSGG